MSQRRIEQDSTEHRQAAYAELDGDAMKAIWSALQAIKATGIDLGTDFTAMDNLRTKLKEDIPHGLE